MRDTRALLAAASCAAALLCVNFSTGRNCCSALVLRTLTPKRGSNSSAKRSSKPYHARGGVSGLRATWIDEQVSLELPGSREAAYFLYSNLQRQPEWSPWLKSVEYDQAAGTSKWVIQSNGVKVSWRARNTVQIPGSEVAWESTTGLGNRGRVAFEDSGPERCRMTLTLSYNLPYVIASVLRLEAVERFVKRTLLGDLGRFKTVLAKEKASAIAAAAATDAPATTAADTSTSRVAADKSTAAAAAVASTAATAIAATSAVGAATTAAPAPVAAATPASADDSAAATATAVERGAGDSTVSDLAQGRELEIDPTAKPASTKGTDIDTKTDTDTNTDIDIDTNTDTDTDSDKDSEIDSNIDTAASGAVVDDLSQGATAAAAVAVAEAQGETTGEGSVEEMASGSGGGSSGSEGDRSSSSSSSATADAATDADALATADVDVDANAVVNADGNAYTYAYAPAAAIGTATADAVATINADGTAASVTVTTDSDAAVAAPAAQAPADTSAALAAEGQSGEEPAGSQRLGRRGRMKKRLRRLFRRRGSRARDRDAAVPPAVVTVTPAVAPEGAGGEVGAGGGDDYGNGDDGSRQ